jgi:RNA polymerase sigma-70 factor (ECF subfamily)
LVKAVEPSSHIPRDGDRLGAEELFRRHAGFVARFVTRLGVKPQEIDDLVQDVFLVAHKKGGWQPGPAQPTTWLAEIALRVASGERRKTHRRDKKIELDESDAASDAPTPYEQASASEQLARVQAALDALPLEQRAVFVLYELEGQSCDEIAAGLGIPVGTVYSRLHKARGDFKKKYERLVADRAARTGAG